MKIFRFDDAMLNDLTCLINMHVIDLPPFCWIPGQAIRKNLIEKSNPWQLHYPDIKSDGDIYCVYVDNQLCAAAEWITLAETSFLLWLFNSPGHPKTLQALLAHQRKLASKMDVNKITTSRTHFGSGWFGIPECWPHIINGLKQSGMQACNQWHMYTKDVSNTAMHLTDHFGFNWKSDPQKREWTIEKRDNDRLIADCDVWDLPEVFDLCDEAYQWTTLESVFVAPDFRRTGLATRMIQAQIQYHYRRGKRHIMTLTETTNTAAQALFAHLHFTRTHNCLEFEKYVD